MNTQISIIGCGWLGLPLAKQLLKVGHIIKGSTTHNDKLKILHSHAIDGYLIAFSPEGIQGDIQSCLQNSETLVLNIPPGLRKQPEKDFLKQMQHLIPFIESSSVKQVLFVSSTAVYHDDATFSNTTETSTTSNTSSAAKILAVEALFQNNKNFKTTIVRFSGLFGEDRHPATSLSGRKNIKNPEAPVNLIHQKDAILILKSIIKQGVWNEVFNASTPFHPTKKNYYTAVCQRKGIALPAFDLSSKSEGKIIDVSKLVQRLNYHFRVKLE